jgi:antitoxin HicB
MFIFAYPVRFRRDKDGDWLIMARDLPELVSQAKGSENRVDVAEGALQAAIEGRILFGDPIPVATAPKRGEIIVSVPVDTAAKAALYLAVRDLSLSKSEFARRAQLHEKEARRLLDPTHPSKLPRIAAALNALGKRLQVSVD